MKLLKAGFLIGASFGIQSLFATDCSSLASWDSATEYHGGNQVQHKLKAYQAAYWTQGNDPETHSGEWGHWRLLGDCDSDPDNQPPMSSMTSPANNNQYSVGDLVSIVAAANDPDGQVTQVEFFINGQSMSVDTVVPYEFSWTAVEGNHQLRAVATDDKNATGESNIVNISVASIPGNEIPQVNLTSPANNSQYALGDLVAIAATASDSDGSVERVEFYVDGALVSSDSVAPYAYDWTSTAGNHTITAKAFDNLAAESLVVSAAIQVGIPPTGDCRPDGLYQTPNTSPNYCSVYDTDGREIMGADHPRRIIGYFTSWRNGANGQPKYLVNQIPWDKLTHINYAFAHVDANNKVSVGNTSSPTNPATGMEWPGVAGAEMDPAFSYKGHFNLLNKYKKQYPHVKTLISVGGWAESGGYFDDSGNRVDSGGFYTMTTNADNSVNNAGINTFADSAVAFIRQYGFDGVDIDYEYPTSMNDAGNPDDFAIANARRAGLMKSYIVLMKRLREKLDQAGQQDNRHYMLTIASPSSGYLLRGMEVFQVTEYLDYVNIMTYDLHGAWNQFVGPNAALYDTGEDSELKAWNYYGTAQYKQIGYLNTDWAFHYFRGAIQAGRINIGVPYYTRGWQGVTGGVNGMWGTAALPDQNSCPPGTETGSTNKCGYGAMGIDNLWHDKDKQGNEMGAGSNPMWHAKNLQNGILGSYVTEYGLDPVNNPAHQLTGSYQRFYDAVGVAPWLWNADKKVFLSIEDQESIVTKAQYIIDRGIGGVMFWELAGDYQFNSVTGEYEMGTTLTDELYNRFVTATPYGNKRNNIELPTQQVDVSVAISGFKLGDQNYPINPVLTISNNTTKNVPGGAVIEFDVPTAIPDNIADQSGMGLSVIDNGSNASGNNIGGLDNEFHRVAMTLKSYDSIPAGGSLDVKLNYYLPMPMPSNWVIKVGSDSFALKQEHPELPVGEFPAGGDGGNGGNGGLCSESNIDPTVFPLYPNWPQKDWAGNPSHALGGDRMRHNSVVYEAKWWTNSVPGSDTTWITVCSL